MASTLHVSGNSLGARRRGHPQALEATVFFEKSPDVATSLAAPLLLPEEIQADDGALLSVSERAVLQHTLAWLDGFVSRENPEMGRSGSVCPFVKPALQQRCIYLSVCPTEPELKVDAMIACLEPYHQALQALSQPPGALTPLTSVVVIFPSIADYWEATLMDTVHERLKTAWLPSGVLLGQFYPSCPVGSTWNPALPVLQSPFPMFVLRNLIESDWRFVQGHPPWAKSYQDWFASS